MRPTNRPVAEYELLPGRSSGQVQLNLIDVTPSPGLARLERLDDRVMGLMKVFGRVLVFGGITATDVSAFQTEPEVNPGVPCFQALLAALGRSRRDLPDFIQMATSLHLHPSFR